MPCVPCHFPCPNLNITRIPQAVHNQEDELLHVLGVFGEPLTRLVLGLVAEEIPKDHGTLEVASDLGLHFRWEVQLAQDGVREVRQQAAFVSSVRAL